MNYPKPAILSTIEPSSPRYISVPEYKTQSIERKSGKGFIFDDFDGFDADDLSGPSGGGMSSGLKTAIMCIAAVAVVYVVYKHFKKRR